MRAAESAAKRDAMTAIRLKCLDCMGNGPGARKLVETCRSPECPLYPFRSLRALQEEKTEHALDGQMPLFGEIGV